MSNFKNDIKKSSIVIERKDENTSVLNLCQSVGRFSDDFALNSCITQTFAFSSCNFASSAQNSPYRSRSSASSAQLFAFSAQNSPYRSQSFASSAGLFAFSAQNSRYRSRSFASSAGLFAFSAKPFFAGNNNEQYNNFYLKSLARSTNFLLKFNNNNI